MATTFVDYTGDGNATKSFSFPSIQVSDVKVEVDNVIKTSGVHYNITGYSTTGGGNVVFTSGNIPSSSADIRIFRDTDVDNPKATYTAGSSVKAADLNNNNEQLLFSAQEEQNQTIQTREIKDSAVTTAKIKDLNVSTAKIADSAITTQKIANSNVTTAKIADSNVTTAKIADSNVTTAKIAADAITGAKIADDQINSEHYVDGSIDTAHIGNSQVTTAKIADSNITTAKIAADAVTNAKIADDSIDSEHYVDGSIDTAHIGDSQITTAKIANDNVTAAKIATNAVTTDKIADGELTTLAGMQSGTASKLADSTALTADLADLNQLDGMAKQTTITDDDTKFPTSGAVVDYVAAQLEPFGGFEAIANESSFPNTQPVSGVVISIADAGGMAVSGSGTASGATVGGTTVNITGIASNFNGTTVDNGIRFLVVSTGSGQNYTYHKATLKEDDLLNLSGDINDFSERYRVGSSNPTTSLDNGDLFFNTGSGKLLVYNGTNAAWEETQTVGNFFINTLSSSSATGGGSATPNGTAYRFTLSNAGTSPQQHLVSVDGVIQKPNSGTSQPSEGFAIDGGDIIFGSAPVNGASIFVITIGASVSIGTPSNNTVTTAILQNGSVTTAKIADDAVTAAKLANTSVTAGSYGSSSAIPAITVDAQGRITAASTNSIDSTSIANGTSNVSVAANGNTTVQRSSVTRFTVNHTGVDVAGNITVSGTVDGVDIAALNTTVGNITTDLVTDTTPQLGGDLDTNSFEINLDDAHAINFGDSQDAEIKHTGSNFTIRNTEGNIRIEPKNGELGIQIVPDANVSLYYDNSKKFETTNGGCTVTGTLSTSGTGNVDISNGAGALTINSGGDIRLANASWTGDYAGKIQHANNFLYFQGGTGTYAFIFRDPGGANRLYIDENGHVLPADNNSYDLGSTSNRWRNVYTNDLNLSNEGSSNDVDGSWGDWTIQEGESDLFLKNNRSGKKYKFNLTEVS